MSPQIVKSKPIFQHDNIIVTEILTINSWKIDNYFTNDGKFHYLGKKRFHCLERSKKTENLVELSPLAEMVFPFVVFLNYLFIFGGCARLILILCEPE